MRIKNSIFHVLAAIPICAIVVDASRRAATAGELTWTSQADHFSISLPSKQWKFFDGELPQFGKKMASNADGTKRVLVSIMPGPNKVGDEFDRGFLNSMHGTKVSASDVLIDGRKAHRLVGRIQTPNLRGSFVALFVDFGGRGYAVAGFSPVSVTDKDPELTECIDSFHLLDLPVAPVPAAVGENVGEGEAFHVGQILGIAFAVLVVSLLALYWYSARAR